MVFILNIVLAAGGALGIVWYTMSTVTFRPILGFFIIACCSGVLGAWAVCSAKKEAWLVCAGFCVVSLAVFTGLQLLAFLISPGTGAAVGPVIGGAAVVCMVSLGEMRNRLRGRNP